MSDHRRLLQRLCRDGRLQGAVPDDATYARLHHEAHEECYIANSVNFPVLLEPQMAMATATATA